MGKHLFFAIVAVATIRCGGGPGGAVYTGSCDLRSSLGMCAEYDGQTPADAARLQSDCAVLGATWSSTATCPRTGTLGGCRAPSSLSGWETGWYYAGSVYTTTDQVRTNCQSKQGTFESP